MVTGSTFSISAFKFQFLFIVLAFYAINSLSQHDNEGLTFTYPLF